MSDNPVFSSKGDKSTDSQQRSHSLPRKSRFDVATSTKRLEAEKLGFKMKLESSQNIATIDVNSQKLSEEVHIQANFAKRSDSDKESYLTKQKEVMENQKKIDNITQWFHSLFPNQESIPSDKKVAYNKLSNIQESHELYRLFTQDIGNLSYLPQYIEHSQSLLQEAREIHQLEVKSQSEEIKAIKKDIKAIKKDIKKLNQEKEKLLRALRASLYEKRDKINNHIKTYFLKNHSNVTSQDLNNHKAKLEEILNDQSQDIKRSIQNAQEKITPHYCIQLGVKVDFNILPELNPQARHNIDTEEKYKQGESKRDQVTAKCLELIQSGEKALKSSNNTIEIIARIYKSTDDYGKLEDKIREIHSASLLSDDKRLTEFHNENLKKLEQAKQMFNTGVKHYKDALSVQIERTVLAGHQLKYDLEITEKAQHYNQIIDISDIEQLDSAISNSTINTELTTQLNTVKEKIKSQKNLQAHKNNLLLHIEDLLK